MPQSLDERSRQSASQGKAHCGWADGCSRIQGPRLRRPAPMSTPGHWQAGPQDSVADTAAARCIQRALKPSQHASADNKRGRHSRASAVPWSTCVSRALVPNAVREAG